jgi:hypothetical protein
LGLLEEPTYRLYHCRRCALQVQICARCDHGNIYCAGPCALIARGECMRRAGARYQRTLRGARRHAERQRRYRERRHEVTHQRFFSVAAACKVSAQSPAECEPIDAEPEEEPVVSTNCAPASRCAFCGRVLPAFARLPLHSWSG